MTIEEAANYLNVSKEWVLKLLKEDVLLRAESEELLDTDVLKAYKLYRDVKREKLLNEMARIDQEMGMYD